MKKTIRKVVGVKKSRVSPDKGKKKRFKDYLSAKKRAAEKSLKRLKKKLAPSLAIKKRRLETSIRQLTGHALEPELLHIMRQSQINPRALTVLDAIVSVLARLQARDERTSMSLGAALHSSASRAVCELPAAADSILVADGMNTALLESLSALNTVDDTTAACLVEVVKKLLQVSRKEGVPIKYYELFNEAILSGCIDCYFLLLDCSVQKNCSTFSPEKYLEEKSKRNMAALIDCAVSRTGAFSLVGEVLSQNLQRLKDEFSAEVILALRPLLEGDDGFHQLYEMISQLKLLFPVSAYIQFSLSMEKIKHRKSLFNLFAKSYIRERSVRGLIRVLGFFSIDHSEYELLTFIASKAASIDCLRFILDEANNASVENVGLMSRSGQSSSVSDECVSGKDESRVLPGLINEYTYLCAVKSGDIEMLKFLDGCRPITSGEILMLISDVAGRRARANKTILLWLKEQYLDPSRFEDGDSYKIRCMLLMNCFTPEMVKCDIDNELTKLYITASNCMGVFDEGFVKAVFDLSEESIKRYCQPDFFVIFLRAKISTNILPVDKFLHLLPASDVKDIYKALALSALIKAGVNLFEISCHKSIAESGFGIITNALAQHASESPTHIRLCQEIMSRILVDSKKMKHYTAVEDLFPYIASAASGGLDSDEMPKIRAYLLLFSGFLMQCSDWENLGFTEVQEGVLPALYDNILFALQSKICNFKELQGIKIRLRWNKKMVATGFLSYLAYKSEAHFIYLCGLIANSDVKDVFFKELLNIMYFPELSLPTVFEVMMGFKADSPEKMPKKHKKVRKKTKVALTRYSHEFIDHIFPYLFEGNVVLLALCFLSHCSRLSNSEGLSERSARIRKGVLVVLKRAIEESSDDEIHRPIKSLSQKSVRSCTPYSLLMAVNAEVIEHGRIDLAAINYCMFVDVPKVKILFKLPKSEVDVFETLTFYGGPVFSLLVKQGMYRRIGFIIRSFLSLMRAHSWKTESSIDDLAYAVHLVLLAYPVAQSEKKSEILKLIKVLCHEVLSNPYFQESFWLFPVKKSSQTLFQVFIEYVPEILFPRLSYMVENLGCHPMELRRQCIAVSSSCKEIGEAIKHLELMCPVLNRSEFFDLHSVIKKQCKVVGRKTCRREVLNYMLDLLRSIGLDGLATRVAKSSGQASRNRLMKAVLERLVSVSSDTIVESFFSSTLIALFQENKDKSNIFRVFAANIKQIIQVLRNNPSAVIRLSGQLYALNSVYEKDSLYIMAAHGRSVIALMVNTKIDRKLTLRAQLSVEVENFRPDLERHAVMKQNLTAVQASPGEESPFISVRATREKKLENLLLSVIEQLLIYKIMSEVDGVYSPVEALHYLPARMTVATAKLLLTKIDVDPTCLHNKDLPKEYACDALQAYLNDEKTKSHKHVMHAFAERKSVESAKTLASAERRKVEIAAAAQKAGARHKVRAQMLKMGVKVRTPDAMSDYKAILVLLLKGGQKIGLNKIFDKLYGRCAESPGKFIKESHGIRRSNASNTGLMCVAKFERGIFIVACMGYHNGRGAAGAQSLYKLMFIAECFRHLFPKKEMELDGASLQKLFSKQVEPAAEASSCSMD